MSDESSSAGGGGPSADAGLAFFESGKEDSAAVAIDMGSLLEGKMNAEQDHGRMSSSGEGPAAGSVTGTLLPQSIAATVVTTWWNGAKEQVIHSCSQPPCSTCAHRALDRLDNQAEARGFTSASAQLDNLRPYFDVEVVLPLAHAFQPFA